MKPKKDITIYDNAPKSKLSSTSVSRGLNNNPSINKIIRNKIQEITRKLDYRHTTFASRFGIQKTNIIGAIVHELNSNFISSENYYTLRIIKKSSLKK